MPTNTPSDLQSREDLCRGQTMCTSHIWQQGFRSGINNLKFGSKTSLSQMMEHSAGIFCASCTGSRSRVREAKRPITASGESDWWWIRQISASCIPAVHRMYSLRRGILYAETKSGQRRCWAEKSSPIRRSEEKWETADRACFRSRSFWPVVQASDTKIQHQESTINTVSAP